MNWGKLTLPLMVLALAACAVDATEDENIVTVEYDSNVDDSVTPAETTDAVNDDKDAAAKQQAGTISEVGFMVDPSDPEPDPTPWQGGDSGGENSDD